MPLYTYKCTNCGHVFEVSQRMSDAPLEDCPVCRGGVRRVINNVGVVFKGQGFYVTDNRRSATIPSSSGTASSDTSATDTATTTTKTEPAAPAKTAATESSST